MVHIPLVKTVTAKCMGCLREIRKTIPDDMSQHYEGPDDIWMDICSDKCMSISRRQYGVITQEEAESRRVKH